MTRVSLEQTAPALLDIEGNRADIRQRLTNALRSEADIIVFPEMALSGYVVDREQIDSVAEPVDGPSVSEIVKALKGTQSIVAVGLCEAEGRSRFNSVVLISADGPVSVYRKTHLFDAEKLVFSQGEQLEVVQTVHGSLGVCVCYDLRFVEVMRVLALKGADMVLAPAAWVRGFDSEDSVAISGLIPQAQGAVLQANLNQVAVVAVSQVGQTDVTRTLGGSVAADGYGRVVGEAMSLVDPGSQLISVDVAEVHDSRIRGPLIRPREDRRTDLYGLEYRGKRL